MDLRGWGDPGSFHDDEKGFLKQAVVILCMCCGLVVSLGLTHSSLPAGKPAPDPIRSEFGNFSRITEQLCAAIREIKNNDAMTISRARQALINCRLHYKRIEYFLDYFFHSSALIYNNPAKYEVEEPYMEFEAPRGFQVIESLLFEKDIFCGKEKLLQQAIAVNESAKDLGSLLYDFSMDNGQLLESLRIELIRIITLGIAGYDAPLLKSGIAESHEALEAIKISLEPFLKTGSKEADSTSHYLARSLALLRANSDFDRFDRLGFLTRAALPLQYHLGMLIRESGSELHTAAALNYGAVHSFARNAFDQRAFPHAGKGEDAGRGADAQKDADAGRGADAQKGADGQTVELGKKLFFEKALSGNGSRSCASCHQPGRYFTDGLAKSIAYDNHSTVNRNAPSLLYAGFQYSQFWDGRAENLEQQILDVLQNPLEMNADTAEIEKRMTPLSARQITIAIASYIRTLSPMNSAFDRYIGGDPQAMGPDQIRGFNLFMGKAQCGTCHFAPLFNGLRPPLYSVTEYEVLGVPVSDDLIKPRPDSDSGRARVYPIPFYAAAFKTPTLRNVAVTGPYMHNGGFSSLSTVMDFYNKGGGQGIGLGTKEQTLPAAPLRLSSREIKQLISFLQALTDDPPEDSPPTH